MSTLIGTLAPPDSSSSGPTGPTGPTGASGPAGATGASGTPGASGAPGSGGGGSGSAGVSQILGSAVAVSFIDTVEALFDPVPIAPGETWEFDAYLSYQADNTTPDVYFALMGDGLSILNADGALWYDNLSGIKFLTISYAVIGTGVEDGGAAVTLANVNQAYQCKVHWVVQNATSSAINANFGIFMITSGITVTVNTGSLFTGLNREPAISSVSGSTID